VNFTSPYVVLQRDNIDTDQIIPAQFLKTTERSGLGPFAFHRWRFRADGSPNPEFPLNAASAEGASVLVAGRNFGCGSSREHAVWALMGLGLRAVVSVEFADIFRANALGNGLLPIQVDAAVVDVLVAAHAANHPLPSPPVSVDLESQTLTLPDGTRATFPIAPFAKHCLLHGIDEMDFLLGAAPDIAAFEAAHPAMISVVADRSS
jgi:3-isopropylmalate/(R)-2-methylmalate dehydratase small subunit